MKNNFLKIMALILFLIGGIILLLSLSRCNSPVDNADSKLQTKVDSLEKVLKTLNEEKMLTDANIKKFDSVDIIAFNSKDINIMKKYYDKDVIVYNNDGTQTKGWEAVEKDMKQFFEMWPDMKTERQLVRFGNGEWVATIDHVTGTFSKPMKMKGKEIKPNGKKLDMNYSMFLHFKNGKIVEEYDMGNNEIFMKQLGLEK